MCERSDLGPKRDGERVRIGTEMTVYCSLMDK